MLFVRAWRIKGNICYVLIFLNEIVAQKVIFNFFATNIRKHDIVYFDDGKMVAVVLEILNEGAVMEVKVGGPIKSNCQIRFIGGTHNNLALLNKRDISDLQAISQHIGIDFFALPFAAQGEDIRQVREVLGEGGANIKLLAKIDSIHGVENYEDILFEADGMIFSRNELQWEIPSEKLMVAQKWASQMANRDARLFMIQS